MAVMFALAAAAPPQAADLYDQGARLYSRQQFEHAEHILRQAAQQKPQSAPVRFLLGATLLQLGRNGEAVQELRDREPIEPPKCGRRQVAPDGMRGKPSVRGSDPGFAAAHVAADEEIFLLLIQAYQDRGDAESALRLADQALARYPRSASLILSKAFAMRESARLEQAPRLLEQALRLDPSSLQARAGLADVLSRGENTKQRSRCFA